MALVDEMVLHAKEEPAHFCFLFVRIAAEKTPAVEQIVRLTMESFKAWRQQLNVFQINIE